MPEMAFDEHPGVLKKELKLISKTTKINLNCKRKFDLNSKQHFYMSKLSMLHSFFLLHFNDKLMDSTKISLLQVSFRRLPSP